MFISMRMSVEPVDQVLESAAKPFDQELASKTMQQESIEFMRIYRRNRIAGMKSLGLGSRDFVRPDSPKCGNRQAA